MQEDYFTAAAVGNVRGVSTINKFGCAPDCDSGIMTDIWDGADGVISTDIWVSPTQARKHNIKSASAADDGDPVGTGARTLLIYGLPAWNQDEVTEIVTLNGTSDVETANAYVIIYRMICLTFGSGGTNAGIITATAQTDVTITAVIQSGAGQSLMTIFAVPKQKEMRIYAAKVELARAGGTPTGTVNLVVKENVDQSDSGFVKKDQGEAAVDTPYERKWDFPNRYSGPCIAKLQVTTNTNNTLAVGVLNISIGPNAFRQDY